jgi:hypothetical protein
MKTAYRDLEMDLSASDETVPLRLFSMEGFSIQISWSDDGDLDGEFKLQGSNNAFTDNVGFPESIQFNANADWEDLPGSDVTVTAAGDQLWNVSDVQYTAVRLVWTRTDGAGEMTGRFESKGFI